MFRASLDAAKVGIDAPPTLCDRAKCEFRLRQGAAMVRDSCILHCRCMAIRMIQGISRCREISERGTSDTL